ncbi:unnamed protein product, partial [Symbiodinium pilosum]
VAAQSFTAKRCLQYLRFARASILLQSRFRQRSCRRAYRKLLRGLLCLQGAIRRWIARRNARRQAERQQQCWLAAAKVVQELEDIGLCQDQDVETDATVTASSSQSSCEVARELLQAATCQEQEADTDATGSAVSSQSSCKGSASGESPLPGARINVSDLQPESFQDGSTSPAKVEQDNDVELMPHSARLRRALPIPLAFQTCPDKPTLLARPLLPADLAKPGEGPLNFSDVTLEPRPSGLEHPPVEAALTALLELQRAAYDWGMTEAVRAAKDAAVTVASRAPAPPRQLPCLNTGGESRKAVESPGPSTGSAESRA